MQIRFLKPGATRVRPGTLKAALKLLNHPEPETLLGAVLPEAFCQEAEAHGYTLAECIQEGKALIDAMGGDPDPLLSDLQLAHLLANTAADLDPYLVLVRLRGLLKDRGRFALGILRDCELQFGRDGIGGKGYIRVPNSMAKIRYH